MSSRSGGGASLRQDLLGSCCYLNVVGSNQGSDELTVRVQLGWITRTEDIQLPTEFAVSATRATCSRHTARLTAISPHLDLRRRRWPKSVPRGCTTFHSLMVSTVGGDAADGLARSGPYQVRLAT
jgi:hypothetical protein